MSTTDAMSTKILWEKAFIRNHHNQTRIDNRPQLQLCNEYFVYMIIIMLIHNKY